ncbi:MAG: hypothetical protein ACK5NC_08510 [Vibrio sp.]
MKQSPKLLQSPKLQQSSKLIDRICLVLIVFMVYVFLNFCAGIYYLRSTNLPEKETLNGQSEKAKLAPKYKLHIQNDTLFFKGEINSSSIDKAFKLVNEHNITTINIDSPGGSVDVAMDFAEWMRDNKIKLVIENECFSSCANYFIPAAASVLVKSGTIVGWHGGALQKEWNYAYPWYLYVFPLRIIDDYLSSQAWIQRESDFYKSVKVSRFLPVIGQSAKYTHPDSKLYYSGWNYDLATLNRLGLTHVTIEDNQLLTEADDDQISVWQISLTSKQLDDFKVSDL